MCKFNDIEHVILEADDVGSKEQAEGYLVEDCQHPPAKVLSPKNLYSTL